MGTDTAIGMPWALLSSLIEESKKASFKNGCLISLHSRLKIDHPPKNVATCGVVRPRILYGGVVVVSLFRGGPIQERPYGVFDYRHRAYQQLVWSCLIASINEYSMSSMRGWQPADTNSNILSFAWHFETTQFITPPNRSQSASLKGLCVEEVHGSGPTLGSLGHLDIDQLTLSQSAHDYSWADLMLSSYGPVGFPSSWEQSYIETLTPYEILEESSVLEYIQHAFLRRALCAALFLFILSTRSDMEPCPHPSGCNIVNQSSSGPSGRPDRQVVRRGSPCCLLEGKTRRACGTSERDVLEFLSRHPGDILLYEGLVFRDTALENASTLQRKAITIVYQVC